MAIGEFLTTAEAAGVLGVSPARVRQFVLDGRLDAERVGTNLLFDRKKVSEFKKIKRDTGRPPKDEKKS